MAFTPWTFPALSVPGPSSSGRTMITPGNRPTSCWPGKPGVMVDVPPWLLARLTPGAGTLCALRIQLGHPSFGVDSANGVDGPTPPRNLDMPRAPSLDPADPNLTRLLLNAVGAHLPWVPW